MLCFSDGIMESLTERLQKNAFDKQENLEVTLFERVIEGLDPLCFHSLVKQMLLITLGEWMILMCSKKVNCDCVIYFFEYVVSEV